MKIGVLTYHDINNYGAQLQASSLQRFLQSLGHEAYLVDYRPWRSRVRYGMVYCRAVMSLDISKLKFEYKKRGMFKDSITRLADLTPKKFYFQSSAMRHAQEFDVLVCGSDELWNFGNYLGYQAPYILDYDYGSIKPKKLSYAASMGDFKPDDVSKQLVRKSLQGFSSIFVRDTHTKAFVESLDSSFAPTRVVDPTLLWDFEGESPTQKEPYLLLTGAGCNSSAVSQAAKKLAKDQGLKIISIGVSPPGLESTTVVATPEQWIGYINNAQLHITTLFHGSIFSMKARKAFCVIVPDEKREKISSLLSWFGQSKRALSPEFTMDEMKQGLNMEFDEAFNEQIELRISESKSMLVRAIGS